MPNADRNATFSFSWRALKLLGRGLYSNPWSALSELVANGFDAGAGTVWVCIDATDKASATVEVIDDGSGMSRSDIDTYVLVGHDKREAARRQGLENAHDIKGRKGIGKLAALFLSQHFFLVTRHADGETAWELDAREDQIVDDEFPVLKRVDATPETPNDSIWENRETGTRLILLEVDLTGYGPQSMAALGSRLANQFLLPQGVTPQILICVRTDVEQDLIYEPAQKKIAFGNFAELAQFFPVGAVQPPELAASPTAVRIPAKELPDGFYEHTPNWSSFPPDPPEDEAWDEIEGSVDRSNRRYQGVHYALTGWIGAHATIESAAARENDERFVKNKYYNPAQIRVYVRGKLASDRLLSQLGLTGTYVNYIEGEISFDLLDDDGLPDIATSNRQDFDETDGRVTLLRALVRPVVRNLIQRRNTLAQQINQLGKAEKERREAAGKRQFSAQVEADLANRTDMSPDVRDDLVAVITNKIQGDVLAKETFRVFISHAKRDKDFACLVDEILRARGATKDEIFFTSRPGDVHLSLDDRSLAAVIKESIVNANTLIFYVTSKHFLASQFCLFEGGAGWATRSVSEYLKLNMEFESIPKFLTNGKSEVSLIDGDGAIALTAELHNYLVTGILNPMIEHLNRGRDIAGTNLLELFDLKEIPSILELAERGEVDADYFEPIVVRHWDAIVAKSSQAYLEAY